MDDKQVNLHSGHFRSIVGTENVITDQSTLTLFSLDETGTYRSLPSMVVYPSTSLQISGILKYCNDHDIKVTPRGAGTSLAGNSVSTSRGIILCLSKMNKIISLDLNNHMITVEAGVIGEEMCNYVLEHGLYYPVDPASSGTSLIGGHVMTNAAGPRSYKYGTTKDFVKAMEVVLADGSIINTGGQIDKSSTGYNLTQLMVGSEGTLGIVTKITLKLIKKPVYNNTVLISFETLEDALNAILNLRNSPIDISAIEFIEREALDIVARYEGQPSIMIEDNCAAHLLIELESNNTVNMDLNISLLADVMETLPSLNIMVADSNEQKELLWHMRKLIGHAVRHYSVYREVDTVVPLDKMVDLIHYVQSVGLKYGFVSVCYGHAGNGNIHVNILKENFPEETWNLILRDAVREIFEEVIRLGGALSGEHGIGILNKEFMHLQFTSVELELMRSIKRVFDPKGILNEGKVLPDGD